MRSPHALPAAKLRTPCDPDDLEFETTKDLEKLEITVGQERVVEALSFGVGIRSDGFNLFALGPSKAGMHEIIEQHLRREAKDAPTPPDWCYVNNFEESNKPLSLKLPSGRGREFREDMESLIDEAQTAIPSAFRSEEYENRRESIEKEHRQESEEAFEEINKEATERGVTVLRTPMGLAVAPMKDGEVLAPDEFEQLSEDEKKARRQALEDVQERLSEIMSHIPEKAKDERKKIRELNREFTALAVDSLFDKLKEKYKSLDEVLAHLARVRKDMVEKAHQFLQSGFSDGTALMGDGGSGLAQLLQQQAGDGGDGFQPGGQSRRRSIGATESTRQQLADPFRRYRVNLIVDNSERSGAPVEYEDHPTVNNLVGRAEHLPHMGSLVTDFMLIKPGALHKANGGYLIIDAHRVLTQPFAWDALKRMLRAQKVRIESIGEMMSWISTVSLEPKPIDLNIKVILVGERMLYYLLTSLDPDFNDLFKVAVDFDDRMKRGPETIGLYARMLATRIEQENLRPFDRKAIARVIERSARVADDSERLSTLMRTMTDLLRESDYWAGKEGRETVTAEDVQRAIDAEIRRSDRIRERMHENILRETILIDTDGEAVAQVNALTVVDLGNFAFGAPSRVTARVRVGKGEVQDIEREVELGGPIHSKGVMILHGYLSARYATERPLSLEASLVFEQSYAGVEGDSASVAELCTLISALADAPIRQSLAITGSINQHGLVQAIGGVNDKIEGFFDICKARGLTGEQGVLIPESNVKDLMLREDVVEACDAGNFRIYPIRTVDEAIGLLTAQEAGERGEDGEFPANSVNRRVEERLREFAERAEEFHAKHEEEGQVP